MRTPAVPRPLVAVCLAATTAFTASCTASAEPSVRVDELRAGIARFLDSAEVFDHVRAVIVAQGDETVFEKYYESTAHDSRNVFSVTKSVMSTLVGIAADEGLVDVKQPLAELLPSYADRMTPAVAGTTLEQLLTQSGGFPDTLNGSADEVFRQPDWVAACLESQDHPPAERFAYSDPGVHLVAAVLAAATGGSVLDYARERLFGPLGIDTEPAAEPTENPEGFAEYAAADFAWPVDPQGINTGFGELKLHPRDMAALGRLFLNEGRWHGEQVVPEVWVRTATTAHVTAGELTEDYGYLWWVGRADGSPAYFAIGYGGQLIAVVPDRDLVVVVSSEVNEHAWVGNTSTLYLVDKVIAPLFAR